MENKKRIYSLTVHLSSNSRFISFNVQNISYYFIQCSIRTNSFPWDGKKVEILKGSIIYWKTSQREK